MGTKLKVLTLNCWGIPFLTQFRPERIEAIGNQLAKGDYDIVLLQEIWLQSDYEKLCSLVMTVLPHAHYFHSGMVGSGLCIFSKHSILETLSYRFSLNGYPQRVLHGDWFAGKMVGLAKLLVDDIRLNIYVTHTHAEYNPLKTDYSAHRIIQSFELSQFIKHTSETCDGVILGGDFNFMPSQLGYSIIRYNSNLSDAWLCQKREGSEGFHANTCDRPDNCFSNGSALDRNPDGQRLDYLMCRANSGYRVDCDECTLTMRRVPGMHFNYSDHEGVQAVFIVKRSVTALPPARESGEIEKHLTAAVPIIDDAMKRVKSDKVYCIVAMVLALILLIFTFDVSLPFGLTALVILLRGCLVVTVAYFFWTLVVLKTIELKGLTAARNDINNALKSNPPL
ncbi:hypothetical protein CAPTEDRAFT_173602 [Capitella teleta]|uniref:sphingomyelin phosphodiesterase n=1 Tax=Capitella teleta TaxID=283909 RepID=X1ZD56_CAPTE|nr:hypothetical protein CAPTEDRAFT_173602 [Capitella teleta]|eukprot:ELU04661.1 hypothetical protein CAPTEDRAFT_173602 [Capitella teleta]